MTTLLSCQNVSQSHGSRTLFQEVCLTVCQGDRIGLIGPNGTGKSTLLQVLAGLQTPDKGEVIRKRSLRVGYVPQTKEYPPLSLLEIVSERLKEIETLDEHEREVQAQITLGKLGFEDPSQLATTLSGGWKKRLDIACEIALDPDLLLLDEPTNHLDLDGILWLENFLKREAPTFFLISHDRYFLENVTSQVIELDSKYPNGTFAVEGPYSQFLEKREAFLEGQIQQQASLQSKVRREIHWLKQTPKARTTKSRSRIQEAHRLQEELSKVSSRNRHQKSTIDFEGTERSTRRLITAKGIGKSLGGKELFSRIDLTLSPGSRLGILGSNGMGKTTLLKTLAGELTPDQGTLKFAEDLKIVYFDQYREQLPLDLPLKEALCPHGDEVLYRGRHIHVNGWAKRFLFAPDRIDLPLGHLSGGERARVLIARLMLKPADVLLLDEPTNDLDIPTLEILEESLADFPGAIILISHDRYLLDRLTDEVVGLGCQSGLYHFADFRQWEAERSKNPSPHSAPSPSPQPARVKTKPKKLSYKEQRELDGMEKAIEEAELEIQSRQEHASLESVLAHPELLREACEALQQAQDTLDTLYQRWEELEKKQRELSDS